MADSKAQKHIDGCEGQRFRFVRRSPCLALPLVDFLEIEKRMPIVNGSKEENQKRKSEEEKTVRGDAESNKFTQFGGGALILKRAWTDEIASTLREDARDDTQDDEENRREIELQEALRILLFNPIIYCRFPELPAGVDEDVD